MRVCAVCQDNPRTGPCAACGKQPVPDLGDDLGGSFDYSRGGALGRSSGPSAYAGGSMGGVGEDDPFADDEPDRAFELAAPSRVPKPDIPPDDPATPPAPLSVPGRSAAAPLPRLPTPTSLATSGPISIRDPAAIIARFPPPPTKIWEAPIYALKVLWRQLELYQDLSSLRRRRSPDVALYERALRAHDAKTFALGLVISGAALFVASVLFFLPVILRFVRSPD